MHVYENVYQLFLFVWLFLSQSPQWSLALVILFPVVPFIDNLLCGRAFPSPFNFLYLRGWGFKKFLENVRYLLIQFSVDFFRPLCVTSQITIHPCLHFLCCSYCPWLVKHNPFLGAPWDLGTSSLGFGHFLFLWCNNHLQALTVIFFFSL